MGKTIKVEQEPLDKIGEIAKEQIEQMNTAKKAEAKQKPAAGAKSEGVVPEPKAEEQQTAEPQDINDDDLIGMSDDKLSVEQIERKADLVNAKLIATEDKDLNEAELAQKQALLEEQQEQAAPIEEKLKRVQKKTQKRINELVAELRTEKDAHQQDKSKIDALESKIDELSQKLTKSGAIEDVKPTNEGWNDLWQRVAEEDKELPYSERREMTKDDLEQFLLDDYAGANEWLAERTLRRRDVMQTVQANQTQAQELSQRAKQLYEKYPNCNVEAEMNRLMQSGVSENDALAQIAANNADFKMLIDLTKEDKKYLDPAEALKEMDRRTGKDKPEAKKFYTAEEVERLKKEAAERERQRLGSLDDAPVNNHHGISANPFSDDPMYQEQLNAYLTAHRMNGREKTEQDFIEFRQKLKSGNRSQIGGAKQSEKKRAAGKNSRTAFNTPNMAKLGPIEVTHKR